MYSLQAEIQAEDALFSTCPHQVLVAGRARQRRPQQLADRRAGGVHHQPPAVSSKNPGEPGPVASPRHCGDPTPMLRAGHPGRVGLQERQGYAGGGALVSEIAALALVIAVAAARAV